MLHEKPFRFFATPGFAGLALLTVSARATSAQIQAVAAGSATSACQVQGRGFTMMLVHGFPLSGELLAKSRAMLAWRYTAVTPDLRSFGTQSRNNGVASMPNMPDFFGLMPSLG